MRFNHVSQTALNVGLVLITLDHKPNWKERLPERLADLTKRLLRSYPITRAILRLLGEPWLSSSASTDPPQYVGSGWSVVDAPLPIPDYTLEGFAVVRKAVR